MNTGRLREALETCRGVRHTTNMPVLTSLDPWLVLIEQLAELVLQGEAEAEAIRAQISCAQPVLVARGVLRCVVCGREQPIVPPGQPGGITDDNARRIGWVPTPAGWRCPLRVSDTECCAPGCDPS
jgi:hypothetical protein